MNEMAEDFLKSRLKQRADKGGLRKLDILDGLIDFCSNDYLGLSKVKFPFHEAMNGSTGSRLISGNSYAAEELEEYLSSYHDFESGLLFNSGYTANLGLFSALSTRDAVFFYDELIHASVRDGLRLGLGRSYSFRHNDISHLESFLKKESNGNKFIAIESLYSMDGDLSPLTDIVQLADKYHANVILDEAHSTGVFGEKGEGLAVSLGVQNKIFARVHTFGKAMGCHGAIVGGSTALREYLINFSRPFIYSTFLPPSEIQKIKAAYEYLEKNTGLIDDLRSRISLFNTLTGIASIGPIQVIMINDRQKAREAERLLREKGFAVKAVLSPTVKEGEERLRLCLHVHNTDEEISEMYEHLQSAIN